jgi:tetratricopeptide repeat protein
VLTPLVSTPLAGRPLIGRVLADQGKIDEARRQFGRALELDPGYEPALQGFRAIGRQQTGRRV